MRVAVTGVGLVGLEAALRKRAEALDAGIYAAAQEIRGDAVELIQRGPKSGRVYAKGNPTRTHRASAPGQPPASDTGTLANSIGVERGQMKSEIHAVTPYALALEWGSRRIAPRPFMTRALTDGRGKIRRIVAAAVRGAR